MLDVSDGLAGDAPHLAAASGVALDLALESLPVAAETIAEARRLAVPVQRFAAEGGEDYELLVALPGDFGADQVREFERACGIALTRVGVDFELLKSASAVKIVATVECRGQTGVEMEALTAAAVGLLTIYDMVKAVDRGMTISDLRLDEKRGGKSGHFRRPPKRA